MPVFEGLLPEPHNRRIQKLLFVAAQWHGLAKLRLHTDATLDIMDNVTMVLGKILRAFQKGTCADLQTLELKRERDARIRREQKKKNSGRNIPVLTVPTSHNTEALMSSLANPSQISLLNPKSRTQVPPTSDMHQFIIPPHVERRLSISTRTNITRLAIILQPSGDMALLILIPRSR
jgi:hypothetical protein